IAEPLVRALLGAPKDARTTTAPSPKWTPPEQADGAPWDAAGNRYVLGLVAYRLLAGTMPYGGAGLRHAMREQVSAAAPCEAGVAQKLRPGAQSFVLKMLNPERAPRPTRASDTVPRCGELLSPDEVSLNPRRGDDPPGGGPLPPRLRPAAARAQNLTD